MAGGEGGVFGTRARENLRRHVSVARLARYDGREEGEEAKGEEGSEGDTESDRNACTYEGMTERDDAEWTGRE